MIEVSYGIVNLIRVAQSFPAAPRIMAQLGPLLRDPNTRLDDVASHLKHDSALSARLLRIANSAVLAQCEPVASIEDAAALIGLREIHRLVGAVSVDHFSRRNYPIYGFTGQRLRDNAVLVGLLLEQLAALAGEDAPTAYTAGLFRSLGKLALAKLADEHAPVMPFRPSDTEPLVGWEKHTFGMTGNQATVAILREWHFPTEVGRAIAGHYDPAGNEHPMAVMLNLAARQADSLGFGLPGESGYLLDPVRSAGMAGLSPNQLGGVTGRAITEFDRINRALA